jgi:hypothetical protein
LLGCVNDGVTTIKADRQLEKRACYGQMNRPSRCSLHQEEFTIGDHPREPTIRKTWFPQWNRGEILWWFGYQYHGAIFCWSHY